MHFNLKVIIFNSIYIKANYNAVKGIRYIVQNLNRILELNVFTTYKPFLPPPSTPQLYYVYFCCQLSPITFYELLRTSANSLGQLDRLYIDPKARLVLLLYTHHLLPIRAQPICILFNSYKLLQTPANSYKLLSQLDGKKKSRL